MEVKVEPISEESLAETTRKQGNSMNISSIIMYKIPTKSLGALREKFENSGIGLDLVEFLSSMVETMDLNNRQELLQIIPDLVDFFKSVDINGDGRMEWSEFVMFVIESVVVTDPVIDEQMFNVSHSLLQSAASRHGVKASKILPEFNRLFVGLGPNILIFDADHHEDTWIDKGVQLKLASKTEDDANQGDKDKPVIRQPKDDRMDKALKCLDFVYLGAREMLIVLRSDMSLEFHRFMARNKVHPDLIQQNGMWHFEQPYDKIQLRQMSWSRAKPKIPWKLFAISESRKVVDTWTIEVGITGIVSLVEHEEIADHSDFIKDILVINNELLHYNYFVSCSMDKKVHLYDLATLRHKATRTGLTAGVQCLAYDNRSLLMAGGFDYNIIAWDLDAEIDRPIFQLWGHSSPICKIVSIGSIDRTLSLDTSGVLRLWDSSKANPNDKEARQIDTLSFVDDTFRNFDVFTNVSSNFGTAHSIIITAQGRKQHLYRVEDMTPKESPPLACGGVLFTYNLLMMITVHSHDVLMFSAESGDEQKKMHRAMLHLEDDLGNELMAACLDDRQRKLIVGEASGNISVYNILSGVRLKRTAKNIPFGVRELIYSPDKTIMALAGPGELYIFDELPNEDGVDTSLRYVQAHDVDVVAIAYSHSLGLIATADCVDTLKIWNYEFMQVTAIINDFSGSKIGTLKFIENYPLLLVGDIHNNFFIVPVGPAEEALGRQRWKATSVIYRKPDAQLHNLEVLSEEEEEEESEEEADEEKKDDSGSQDDEPRRLNGGGEDEEKAEPELIRQPSADSADDDQYRTGTDDDEEDDNDPQKPLKKKALKEYLGKIREPKCLEIIVQKSSAVIEAEEEEEDELYQGRGKNRLLELLGKKFTKEDDDEEEDEDYLSESETESESENEMDPSKKYIYTSTAVPFPKKGLRVSVVCGYDDGHCAIIDLTPVMRIIGVSHLRKHEQASNKKGYNPRRTARRYLKETEIKLTTWNPWEVDKITECWSHLSAAWAAHSAAVTTLYAIKDDTNIDVLTAGQDKAVYTWSLNALLKGTLTRGRDWDKLFRPRWATPYSEAFREKNRTEDAKILNDALGLARFMHRAQGKGGAASLPGVDDARESRGLAKATVTSMSLDGSQKSSITFSQKGGGSMVASASEPSLKGTGASLDISDAVHVSSLLDADGSTMVVETPERDRVIGQLAGKITYQQSAKDISAAVMMEKQASRASLQAEVEEKKRRRQKNKKKNIFDIGPDEPVKKSQEAVWLDELMGGSSGSHVEVGAALKLAQKKVAMQQGGKKERKIKTKYDQELQQIDENDPNNWESSSSNRQRALYERLYAEKDKAGVVKDPMVLFEHKLNNLVGGNFRVFLETIRDDREKARRSIVEGSLDVSQEGAVPTIGMQESVVTADLVPDNGSHTPALNIDVSSGSPTAGEPVVSPSPNKEERLVELERHKKKLADETYVKFQWEGSLRTPIYPTSLQEQSPQPRLTPEKSPKKSMAELSTPPVSPVRLTSAQILALEERNAIMGLKKDFEEKLSATEELSRKNSRVLRKKDRKIWKEQRQYEREAALSPAEKVRLEIKKGKSRAAADALSAMKASMPPIQRRNNRHSFAALVHNRSTTIDEVMEATRKQKKAEESWVRKMKYTLDDHGDELTSRTSRRSKRKEESEANHAIKPGADKTRSQKLLQSRDARILQKKDFGPYKTKDLIGFMRCFQTLPPEQTFEEENSVSISIVLSTDASKEGKGSTAAEEAKNEKKEGAGDGDEEWDDFSIESFEEEDEEDEEKETEEEEEEAEEDDEEVKAARLAEEAREKEEKERQQKEDEEKAAEAKHAQEVVNMNVRLLNLINTKWMSLNAQFKTELQKVLTKRSDGGILPRNVLISLEDALTFCCPYMQLPDRQLCLRLFVLKTPRSVEHTEATEKGLTREQLRKLKAMFEFFDKDNSGGIDKFEIVEVLQKLAENKKKEVTSDKFNDDDEKGVDITDAEALIESVAGVDQPELDFDCFVKMFKNLV